MFAHLGVQSRGLYLPRITKTASLSEYHLGKIGRIQVNNLSREITMSDIQDAVQQVTSSATHAVHGIDFGQLYVS